MKQNSVLWVFLTVAILMISPGCKKETTCKSCNANPTPVNHPPLIDKFPVADAGRDTTIFFLPDSLKLDGSASHDSDGTIKDYEWREIWGTVPVTINNSQNAIATATNLAWGGYAFELKVRDNTGLFTVDTVFVAVTVKPDETSQEFNHLMWTDSCFLQIKNIFSYFPPNATFRVFMRSDFYNTISWWTLIEHSPGDLFYEIVNGEIRIHEKYIDCNFDTTTYDILIDWD